MSEKHQTWGWMLAVDFFFAGMGGAMLVVAALVELLMGGTRMSLAGNLLGPVFMCVGCGFLILELGRPFQAWRVFMNPKAILTFGAWLMSIAIVSGFVYAAAAIDHQLIFWSDWIALQKLLAVINLVTGLVVATYPGVLLGRHKGRPFWVGPGIMGLFLLSSLVTGCAAHLLCELATTGTSSLEMSILPLTIAGLLFAQLLLWIGYLWIKQSGTTSVEAASAQRWISGDLSVSFKLGLLFVGTLVPLVVLLFDPTAVHAFGALLVLFGGLVLRILTIRSGQDRTFLPGEEKYRRRLPGDSEEFLKKNWL